MDNKFFGNYRGFVIDNADPRKAGRVKVWVPSIHGRNLSIFDSDEPDFIGGLSKAEVQDFKNKNPWADVAQSLVGGGGGSSIYDGAGFNVGDGVQFTGGEIPVVNNKVDPEQLRGFLINQIKSSKLNGLIPSDGSKFNIDGSAESWANFFVTLAGKESSYKIDETGDLNRNDIPSGSHGLFQLSPEDATNYKFQDTPYTLGQLQDPTINTKATIAIAESLLSRDNIIAGGNDKGMSRYWGPLRRGEIKTPPVPPYTPTSPNNQLPERPDTDLTKTNEPIRKQKPAQAFSPNSSGFKVTNETREQMGGSSAVKQKGRPISLDFNSTGGRSGIMIVAPSDITPQEREICNQYLQGVSNFFAKYSKDPKSKKINSNPIRVKGVNNDRGINGFFHTEPFDEDGAAMDAVIQNPQEFANVIASTLGKIPNALIFPPHTSGNARGTSYKPNSMNRSISEVDFAREYIIPFLNKADNSLTIDAFSSVGSKHPEENRDEQFLSSIGVSQSNIDSITQNGKDLYKLKIKAKSDSSGRYDQEIENSKTQREQLWDNIELDDEKQKQKSDYISRNNLDYTEIPLGSKVNVASQTYGHSPYNNVSKGSFSIPDVGAKVWVFFAEGDMDSPVVFANNPDAQDYAGIFNNSSNSPDLPVEKVEDEVNINRDKYVMNNRGGSFELVGTTGNESVKLSSYQGSAIDLNKFGMSEFVVGNRSQLVKGDSFKTIRGDDLSYCSKSKEIIVKGDCTEKHGNVRSNVETAEKIKELYKPIHDKARLFDVKRTDSHHPLDTSPLQEKSGTNAPCPTCSGDKTFTTRTSTTSTYTDSNASGKGTKERINSGTSEVTQQTEDTATCFNCNGTGESNWTTEGTFEKEPLKDEIADDINNTYDEMTRLENELGDGGNKTTYITKSHVVHIGAAINDLESIRIDPKGKRALLTQTPSKGGKVVTPSYVPIAHIEKVATSDLAGGDFFMEVANKYDLLVGANGIRLKSLGEFAVQGRILTLAAEQVIISSNNQVVVDAGVNYTVKADSITMSPRPQTIGGDEYKNMAIDGTVSISNNAVVAGGMHIEGETSVQHITAPMEIQETETSLSHSNLIAGIRIGTDSRGGAVMSVAASDFAVSSHSHPFANLPLTLVPTNDDVRRNAHCMSLAPPVLSQPVNNKKARLKDYACIRYFNPELFELFDDCNDDDYQRLLDDIMDGTRPIDEVKAELTKASNSRISSTFEDKAECEVDRDGLNQPKND